jgi:hypothetical protein
MIKRFLFITMVCIISSKTSFTQVNQRKVIATSNLKLQQRLDEYLKALTRLNKFNGCVYVTNQGQDVLKKAYNISSKSNSSLWVNNSSQFDIHSVSKLMAYSILVKLQQEHKVKFTDTIIKYLPELTNSNRITIDQLLHHSSGLPRELKSKSGHGLELTENEIIALISKEDLKFTPGTSTMYSNVGYELLYLIIGKITGKPFAQYVKEYLFEPLHMNASGAHLVNSYTNLRHPAQNHQLQEGVITRIPNTAPDAFPTALIYSTTGDLMLYLQSLHDTPFQKAMSNTQGVIEKNGGSDGIRAQIYTNTRLNYSFVLLSNYDEMPFQQTIEDLISILEGKPYKMPAKINRKAIDLAVDVLKRYTGTYDIAEFNHMSLEFRVEDTKLALYKNGKKLTDLFAESKTLFFEDAKLPETFEFKPNGSSWELVWTYQGVRFKGKKLSMEK